MSQKYKTKSGEYVKEYTRPGVCQVCGHASVRPDGYLYEEATDDDGINKDILVQVYCHECVPANLRKKLFYKYIRGGINEEYCLKQKMLAHKVLKEA